MQYITRKGSFDAGHRVMFEKVKCFNVHGHGFHYELTFSFKNCEDIGYAIDFKEIKRVGAQWVEDFLDHGMILNPHDYDLIEVTKKLKSKLWIMSLNGQEVFCNPSAENIAKELFLAQELLFSQHHHLKVHNIRLFETDNCFVDCVQESISPRERANFYAAKAPLIISYAKEKGIVEYDSRKSKT